MLEDERRLDVCATIMAATCGSPLTNTDAFLGSAALNLAGPRTPSRSHNYSVSLPVAFSCQGFRKTLDFSLSVEMLSSAADKSFLCFPESLQNLEKQLQSGAGTAGFFYLGRGLGGGSSGGSQGEDAEHAPRLMVKIHGGSRYLGSGWGFQLFQALRAKTMNIKVEMCVLRVSLCFCGAEFILWESRSCPSCCSFGWHFGNIFILVLSNYRKSHLNILPFHGHLRTLQFKCLC